jgi:hypothetical protein
MAKRYARAPEMIIDPNKHYEAMIHTSRGNFTVALFASQVPITVNNCIFLADAW